MDMDTDIENKGFNEVTIHRVYRIFDVLVLISENNFLKKRLTFKGGTALNFIIFPKIERLSVDLDFDFREIDSKKDWEMTRNNVDSKLKEILKELEYEDSSIRIDAKYPLTRFIVKYDLRTSFNIEIGYMNRYSLFSSDEIRDFVHPKTKKTARIQIPKREEIFGGKIAALIARKIPRDLFDVAMITKQKFDKELLRKILLLKNVMNTKYDITNLDFETHLEDIQLDDNLMVVLGDFSREDFQNHKEKAIELLKELQGSFNQNERDFISTFLNKKEFNIDLLGKKEIFHPKITMHPSILWSLKKIKQNG